MSNQGHRQASVVSADLLVGVAAFALGAGALLLVPSEVSQTGFQSFGNVRSPAFFPILSAGLLVAFSAALLARALLRAPTSREEAAKRWSPRAALVAVVLVGAGVAVGQLGFLITSAALIVALSYAFGARQHLLVAALAVAVPAAIHLLFRSILDVLLPTGALFS